MDWTRPGVDLDHGADHASDGSNTIMLLDAAQKRLSLLSFLSLSKDAEQDHHDDERKEHEHEQAAGKLERSRRFRGSGVVKEGLQRAELLKVDLRSEDARKAVAEAKERRVV